MWQNMQEYIFKWKKNYRGLILEIMKIIANELALRLSGENIKFYVNDNKFSILSRKNEHNLFGIIEIFNAQDDIICNCYMIRFAL